MIHTLEVKLAAVLAVARTRLHLVTHTPANVPSFPLPTTSSATVRKVTLARDVTFVLIITLEILISQEVFARDASAITTLILTSMEIAIHELASVRNVSTTPTGIIANIVEMDSMAMPLFRIADVRRLNIF